MLDLGLTLAFFVFTVIGALMVWRTREVEPWSKSVSEQRPLSSGAEAAVTAAPVVGLGAVIGDLGAPAVGMAVFVLGMTLGLCLFVFLRPAILLPPKIRGRGSLYRSWVR